VLGFGVAEMLVALLTGVFDPRLDGWRWLARWRQRGAHSSMPCATSDTRPIMRKNATALAAAILRTPLSAFASLALALLLAACIPANTRPMGFSGELPAEVSSVFVRLPQSNVVPGQPLRVLVALHGIGGDGATFASDLAAAADQHGWLLVAPTVAYGDWCGPSTLQHP
jgi:hypothetical protein